MYVIAHASALFQRGCNMLVTGKQAKCLRAWGRHFVEIRIELRCKPMFFWEVTEVE